MNTRKTEREGDGERGRRGDEVDLFQRHIACFYFGLGVCTLLLYRGELPLVLYYLREVRGHLRLAEQALEREAAQAAAALFQVPEHCIEVEQLSTTLKARVAINRKSPIENQKSR